MKFKFALALLLTSTVQAANISEQLMIVPPSMIDSARERLYESISVEKAQRAAFYAKGDYLCEVSKMDRNKVLSVSKERVHWDIKNRTLDSSVYMGEMDFVMLDSFRAPRVKLFLTRNSLQLVTEQKVFDCN